MWWIRDCIPYAERNVKLTLTIQGSIRKKINIVETLVLLYDKQFIKRIVYRQPMQLIIF